jgi:hypothetical protein
MTEILDVSPTRSNTVLTESSDYQSVSGRMLALTAGASGRLYAGTYSGVWRSDDEGKTFTQSTRPQPAPDGFDVPGSLGGYEVYDLAVSPVDPDVVLAITRYDLRSMPRHGIYRSTDGGKTWTLVHQFPGLPRRAGQAVWASRDEVYAAWGTSLAISHDGGASFVDSVPWGLGAGAAYHVAVEVGESRSTRVYALGDDRIWVSLDGGRSWQPDLGAVPTPSGQATGDAQASAPRVLQPIRGVPNSVLLISDPVPGEAPHLWVGDYTSFETTGRSSWKELPLPELDRDSGNHFVGSAFSDLVFFCARSQLFVARGVPRDAGDWLALDGGHRIHADLHGVFFSPHFAGVVGHGRLQLKSGTMWVLSDGGVYRSVDGSTFEPAQALQTLGTVNIAGVAQPGATALCLNTGDNSGFYSLDGGATWKTQAYLGGDNDCAYADPLQPDRILVFTPRDGGDDRSVTLYVDPTGGLPDGRKGTTQAHRISGPPAAFKGPNWNAVSPFALRGYRPVVLTLRGEQPLFDGDYVFIRFTTDDTAVLLRTQAIRSIGGPVDWDTSATSPDSGAHVYRVGPPLPSPDVGVVQASGGHAETVFYVGMDAPRRMWTWADGMADWRLLVPAADPGGPQAARRFFVDPYRPSVVFVVDDTHVWRSEDGGATWVVDAGLERLATDDGAMPSGLDHVVDVIVQDMQFDPDDPLTRYAVGAAGAFFTTDGVEWSRLLDAIALPGRPTSCYYDAVSDPCQRSLYVGLADRGVVKLSPLPWGALQAPHAASWSQNVQIQGQSSRVRPALALFRGVIHMVHVGDLSNDIFWSTSTDGITWTTHPPIPGQKSKAAPALAVFGDRLHMVHLGNSSNDIWWSMYDGTSWTKLDGTPGNERIPGQQSKATPALAVLDGVLHMVHLGDSSNDLWWSVFDGTSWIKYFTGTPGNDRIQGQQSKAPPALAVLDGVLHMVHLGDSSNDLWWSTFHHRSWESNTRIRCQKSKVAPALATEAGRLHMVHLGDESNLLWWSMYGGDEWTPNLIIPGQRSKDTPALLPVPDVGLFMIHLGDSSDHLWRSGTTS